MNTTTTTAKRITRTTFKSFLAKNDGRLMVRVKSKFDGQVDGCVDADNGFSDAQPSGRGESQNAYTFGIAGVWCVGHGGDHYTAYAANGMTGIEVYNACGTFIVAVRD
jgi:hypothetical protein